MEERVMIRAGVPPPPSEVKIRTMRSDLASMAQSGGGAPSFQNVAVENLSIEKEYTTPDHAPNLAQPAPTTPAEASIQESTHRNIYPILIVAVVAILAIGVVGYFTYTSFFAGSSSNKSPAATQAPTLPTVATATSTATTTAPSSGSDELSSSHISLFKKPADQIITIDFTGVSPSTYQKTMANSLSEASAVSSMIEIDPKGSDGNNLSIQGLLSVAGAPILSQQALDSFDPDATFFVYRDKNGLWPGYVLALNAGETSLSVVPSVKQLEQSTNIGNLFLADSGSASSGGFTNSTSAGIPVRVLAFSGVTTPLYFVYGLYGDYLILSTSNNGFAAAIADLQ